MSTLHALEFQPSASSLWEYDVFMSATERRHHSCRVTTRARNRKVCGLGADPTTPHTPPVEQKDRQPTPRNG